MSNERDERTPYPIDYERYAAAPKVKQKKKERTLFENDRPRRPDYLAEKIRNETRATNVYVRYFGW